MGGREIKNDWPKLLHVLSTIMHAGKGDGKKAGKGAYAEG